MRVMAARECYRNALITAERHGLAYAEGYAWSQAGCWVAHAWNVDSAGRAVDRAWRQPAPRYVGMIIPAGRAWLAVGKRGCFGAVVPVPPVTGGPW